MNKLFNKLIEYHIKDIFDKTGKVLTRQEAIQELSKGGNDEINKVEENDL